MQTLIERCISSAQLVQKAADGLQGLAVIEGDHGVPSIFVAAGSLAVDDSTCL